MICIRHGTGRALRAISFLRSSLFSSHQPNAPLDIDESFRDILQDIGNSAVDQKLNAPPRIHELTAYPTDSEPDKLTHLDDEPHTSIDRKSPAALFGSQRIGAVVIPQELQQTIAGLISDSDKHLLRRDVKRLFNEHGDEDKWNPAMNVRYKSYKQARHHAERDGTAFASIVLPAHYSAIHSVLCHVRLRLGPQWSVQNVFDWGAGTGSALWAACYAFQNPSSPDGEDGQMALSSTAIVKYVGIEKRSGLVSIGRQLLEGVPHGGMDVSWQRKFHSDNIPQVHDGSSTVAISAFFLSTLNTQLQRKALIEEIWECGAETIVLLDHSNPAGFQSVAEARELLLNLGRKEAENQGSEENQMAGSHVLAPCPHDHGCPIHWSEVGKGKLVCGFSQRMERPPFVRRTKHSGVGHEDIGYSYVVIRRGPRPRIPDVKVGRLGEVGRRQIQNEEAKRQPVELELHDGDSPAPTQLANASVLPEEITEPRAHNPAEIDSLLKAESFHWPRLVFPPLKKSGHVVMDVCAPSGSILRMTVPKSQGKQPYYDARKSAWGDTFPHEPKNPPQVRFPQCPDEAGNSRRTRPSKRTTDKKKA
ncbi:mitochondrial small ribosomal subunit Rsm22-domain-containing protein [Lactarius quietus]|nr:mitochondrial small ribosomal subunit Rsm22-domain-containing protein [Lactarius quietus]